MKKFLPLLLFPVAAMAQNTAGVFKLDGTVRFKNNPDWVYLSYRNADQVVMDSVQPKNGTFTFKGSIPEPETATLSVKSNATGKKDAITLFLSPADMKFVAQDSLQMNSFTGSPAHLDFIALDKKTKSYDKIFDPLYQAYNNARGQKDRAAMEKIESEIDKLDEKMRDDVYGDFVRSNPNSPVSVYALKRFAGYELDPAKIDPLYNSLSSSAKTYPSAVAFKEQLEIARKTAVGNMAMDFTQEDTAGHAVSLSSFRGKYVLVDFWASWCAPCRQENPNVVKAFNRYSSKNFTILGVSLDRPNGKEKWMKAIHDDGLYWNQVSDLKFWDNAVAKEYGIRAIPQNILIDPQGKIIAKNLRGEELNQKLAELFPN